MTEAALTYDSLVVSPFELVNLLELTIAKKVNDHACLKFTGIVSEEVKDSYVLMCDARTTVKISQRNEQGTLSPLFCGIVRNIAVKAVRGVYHLEVEAVSHTFELDVKKRSRSFQNKSMTYPDLLNTVKAPYPGIDIIDEATGGGAIGRLTMQYLETDWQFLTRLASRLRTVLIPSVVFDEPKFFFGLPDGSIKGAIKESHYQITKRMDPYRHTTQNTSAKVQENDYIYYEVESERVFQLGDTVQFKGSLLYVIGAFTEMKQGQLTHLYTLSSREGLRPNPFYNDQIIGVSIQGQVIAVQKDTVKVHLAIDDAQQASDAHCFPYASVYTAEGNSGWYCMPEVGDHVRVYFPGNREEEGVASSSVRQNSDEGETNKLGNPDHKYFRTAAGKELMMTPEEVVITGKDGEIFIRLSESGGIEISSSKEIKLVAKEDILMNAEQNITISAKDKITLTSSETSTIEMDGRTVISGLELKTN
ncbi:hypothetical protein YSY43_21820 [Paenibacillus sp. YSY-4.3]